MGNTGFIADVPEASNKACQAVVIGGSAGSLHALATLLKGLPGGLPVPLVTVLHTGTPDMADVAAVLARGCGLPVLEAREREIAAPGKVYLAPGKYHLLIERDRHFSLSADARVCYSRPSIDVLFESAADAYKGKLIAVVLTGANQDGAAGAAHVQRYGGAVLVQDPDQAEAAVMPRAAIAATRPQGPHWVGPVETLSEQLLSMLGSPG